MYFHLFRSAITIGVRILMSIRNISQIMSQIFMLLDSSRHSVSFSSLAVEKIDLRHITGRGLLLHVFNVLETTTSSHLPAFLRIVAMGLLR